MTQDAAALVTDSRYWVQAEQQLEGSGIELVKLNQGYAAESADWFAAHLMANDCVGINSELISGKDAKNYARVFAEKHLHLSLVRQTPEETIWEERPERAEKPIFDHTVSPRNREQKLTALREVLKKKVRTICLLRSSTISHGFLTSADPTFQTIPSSTPTP